MENLQYPSNKHEHDTTPEQAAIESLTAAREQGVGIFRADMNESMSNEEISTFLTEATESKSTYELANPVRVDLTQTSFGPVEFAGEQGVNTFRVLEGAATLRTVSKKKAREMVINKGDVIILDAMKETFFALSSHENNEQLIVESFRNKVQDVAAYERGRGFTGDNTTADWARQEERRRSRAAEARFDKLINKPRRSLGQRALRFFKG